MSYETSDYFLMFIANFAIVFLLGLQSRNVTSGNYLLAIITSFGISVSNFTFIKYAASGDISAFMTCAVGGCFGIATSIWFYEHIILRKGWKKRKNSGLLERPDAPLEGFEGLPKIKCYQCIGDDSGCDGVCETKVAA